MTTSSMSEKSNFLKNDSKVLSFNGVSPKIIKQLLKIDSHLGGQKWSFKGWYEEFSNGHGVVFLNYLQGEIVGFSLFRICPFNEEVHLLKVVTLPEYRNCGLALNNLSAAIEYFDGLGAKKIILDVEASNQGAIKLYKSLKFLEYAKKSHYYSNGETGILMVLMI